MIDRSSIISEWFRLYSHDVYDYLVYYTGRKDVEDLVQETFIKVNRGFNSYKENSSPKTWIISIARHVAIDEARKKKNKMRKQSIPFDERIGITDTTTPETIALKNEQLQELYQSIQKLKKSYRDVIILRGIKGLTVKETAEVLHWKESKVRTNYYRALTSLKKQEFRRGNIT